MIRLRRFLGLDPRTPGRAGRGVVWMLGLALVGLAVLLAMHVPLDLGGICLIFAAGLALLRGPPLVSARAFALIRCRQMHRSRRRRYYVAPLLRLAEPPLRR